MAFSLGLLSTSKPCAVLVAQSCLTLCDPMIWSLPGTSVHGDSPGKNIGVSSHALLQGDLPDPEIKSRSLALQVDSLLSEPLEKPHSKSCLSAFEQHAFEWQNLNLAQNPSCKKVKTCFFVSLSLSLFLVLIIQGAGKKGVEKDSKCQKIISIPVPLRVLAKSRSRLRKCSKSFSGSDSLWFVWLCKVTYQHIYGRGAHWSDSLGYASN